MRIGTVLVGTLLSVGLLAPAPGSAQSASARLINPDGADVGSVTITQLARGVQVVLDASDLPAGEHAFHIHAVGACEPPEFASAGGHANPTGAEHGWDNPNGHHAGDLPNMLVTKDGSGRFEAKTDAFTLKGGAASLFDSDGSALVIHAGVDDYMTDPTGNAGDRAACGLIVAGK